MSRVLKCDVCGKTFKNGYSVYTDLAFYYYSSGNKYRKDPNVGGADICTDCYNKIKTAVQTGKALEE